MKLLVVNLSLFREDNMQRSFPSTDNTPPLGISKLTVYDVLLFFMNNNTHTYLIL